MGFNEGGGRRVGCTGGRCAECRKCGDESWRKRETRDRRGASRNKEGQKLVVEISCREAKGQSVITVPRVRKEFCGRCVVEIE